MNPLNRLLGAIADRTAAESDASLTARGFVVTRRADGSRMVSHPAFPALAEAYAERIRANPDELDRQLLGLPAAGAVRRDFVAVTK